jgi:GTP-binding protein
MASFRNRVGLIGRPNVGKSSLFNKLSRTRKAVVRDEPGVTRDVLIEPCEWWGRTFDIVDTGGITEERVGLSPLIREQTLSILGSLDALIVILDGRAGLIPEDRDIVRIAKETGKPVLLAVNKLDSERDLEIALAEFHEFGLDLIPCAFERDFGIDRIVEWISGVIPSDESTLRQGPRLTVIGKPNVGKSSLCNRLLGEKRMLVSDIAGTTVDAVEAEFAFDGKAYTLIDTAGLRKQAKREEGIEALSAVKSKEAVRRSDIVLLVVDATEGPTVQDAKMLEMCLDLHKAVILVANKYDIAKDQHENTKTWFAEKVQRELHFFPDVRTVFVSALTGSGLNALFEEVESVFEALHFRISTSQLNKFFTEVIRQAPAPVYGTVNVKFYYLTQTHQTPPSFIAFANHPDGVTPGYRRFLAKRIQDQWGLKGIPIRIFVMPSGRRARPPANKEAEG